MENSKGSSRVERVVREGYHSDEESNNLPERFHVYDVSNEMDSCDCRSNASAEMITNYNKGRDELKRLEEETNMLHNRLSISKENNPHCNYDNEILRQREEKHRQYLIRNRIRINLSGENPGSDEKMLLDTSINIEEENLKLKEEEKLLKEREVEINNQSLQIEEVKRSVEYENKELNRSLKQSKNELNTVSKEYKEKCLKLKQLSKEEEMSFIEFELASKNKKDEEFRLRELNEIFAKKQSILNNTYKKRVSNQEKLINDLYQTVKTQSNIKYHFFKSKEPEVKNSMQISAFNEEHIKAKKIAEQKETKLSLALIEQKKKEDEKQKRLEEARKSRFAGILKYKYDIALVLATACVLATSNISQILSGLQ